MAQVKILTVKPFRNTTKHYVEAEFQYKTGMLWWKTLHTETLKLVTQDGLQWHYAPEAGGRRVVPELEAALYDALEQYQALRQQEAYARSV